MKSIGSPAGKPADPGGLAVAALRPEQLVAGLLQASPEDASVYAQEIIRRFEPAMRHAWQHGAFHVEYRDFVQDVFVRLFGCLRSLRNPRAFPGYLYQVARSVAASHARRSASFAGEPLAAVAGVGDRFDETLLAGIFVRSYLRELPPREREVAELAFLEQRPAKEIGRTLGLSPSAVRATKTRAARRLRRLLVEEADALEREIRGR